MAEITIYGDQRSVKYTAEELAAMEVARNKTPPTPRKSPPDGARAAAMSRRRRLVRGA